MKYIPNYTLTAVIQRIYDSRNPPSRRGRNNRLNVFPGSPDIVVSPDAAAQETTVRAVLEDDDPRELDAVMPVTTIQVHLEAERNDESNAVNTRQKQATNGMAMMIKA